MYPQSNQFQLNSRRYRVIKKIAEGGFSTVYLVRSSESHTNDGMDDEEQQFQSNELFALKEVRLQLEEQEQVKTTELFIHVSHHVQAFKKELGYYRQMNGMSNIIRLIDGDISSASGGKRGLFVFPFHKLGSAQRLYCTPFIESGKQIEFSKLKRLSLDICKALQCFHSQQPALAFRDLKVICTVPTNH